jgi:hypothetical protein
MLLKNRFFLFIIITVTLVVSINAQTTITGTVKSTNGGVLGNADVSLAVLGLKTKAGSDGKFIFSNITSAAGETGASHASAPRLIGSRLYFYVSTVADNVSIDLFTAGGNKVRSLIYRQLGVGQYAIEAFSANLAAGLYIVRVKINGRSHSFVMPVTRHGMAGTALLNPAQNEPNVLAKKEFQIVDSIITELTGYYRSATPIPQYSGDYTVVLNVKPAAVNTKIYSERAMAQIDWGKTTVEVWDNYGGPLGTQLNGTYPDAFEGTNGWQAVCGQGWSAWVFKSTVLTGVDMSAFLGGSLHVAIKGSAPSVGIFVSSVAVKSSAVDLDSLGYKNDGAWHEITVPLSRFVGLDLTQVSVYTGFAAPADSSKDYAPGLSYVMDDLYFKPK